MLSIIHVSCGLFISHVTQSSEDLYTTISCPISAPDPVTFTERLKVPQLAIKLVVGDQASIVLYILAKREIPSDHVVAAQLVPCGISVGA